MKPRELVAKWIADESSRGELATIYYTAVLDMVEQAYAEGQRDMLEAAAKLRDGAGKEGA